MAAKTEIIVLNKQKVILRNVLWRLQIIFGSVAFRLPEDVHRVDTSLANWS